MYLIVVDYEQLCVYVGGVRRVGRGFTNSYTVLLNFINIAKRRSFSATSQASDVHCTNNTKTSCRARCCCSAMQSCTLLRKHHFFDLKFNLPMGVFF